MSGGTTAGAWRPVSARGFVPNLEIKFTKNEIMNQLSYAVLNTKFKSKGFSFNGNLKKGIMETIDLLMNKSKTIENHTLTKKSSTIYTKN